MPGFFNRRFLFFAVVPLALTAVAPNNTIELHHFDPSATDKTLNPCDDFFKYTCGPWVAKHPIANDQTSSSTSTNLDLWNLTVLKETLETAAQPSPKHTKAERLIGDYWAACMNEEAIEKAGVKPLEANLKSIAALKNIRGLAAEVAKLHLAAGNSFGGPNNYDNSTPAALLGVGSMQDYDDASLVVGVVDQGGLGLPSRDSYLNDDEKTKAIRLKYVDHVAAMFVLLGTEPDEAKAQAQVVLDFETALAQASRSTVERRDPKNNNNRRSLAQLNALTPSFDWAAYFKATQMPPSKHYLVTTPAFLERVETLLKEKPLEQWKTYLRWWLVHTMVSGLPKAFMTENFNFFSKTLLGATEQRPRWRRCVQYADRDLGEALGEAYVARAFPASSKKKVDTMVSALRDAMERDIDQLEWMSAPTKAAAKTKLKAIQWMIGNPAVFRDYRAVPISRESMLANFQNSASFEVRRQLKKIGKPVDRTEWLLTPSTINAYYDPQSASIVFPAGILQPPFFEADKDWATNLGAIGSIIGHEIVHGFDDEGRKFDAQGNFRDWWAPDDAKKYEERSACIAKQYTVEVPSLGVKTNGHLTLGEDTADNGGLHIALMALESLLKAEGHTLDEVGTDGMTHRQRFFAARAFPYCSAQRPEAARQQVQTNPHSLSPFRVNNPSANSPDFQVAFSCKPASPMAPTERCHVW